MWLKRFSYYVLNHPWPVVAILFIATLVPGLGMLTMLVATFVTLCQGAKRGALLTLAATLPCLLGMMVSVGMNAHGMADLSLTDWATAGIAIISNVLTYGFAVLLRRGRPISSLLEIAALFGVLVVSVLHLIYPDLADWWTRILQQYYGEAKAMMGTLSGTTADRLNDLQQASIQDTKYYATGLFTAAILFNAMLQLFVARWWQAITLKPALKQEWHQIHLAPLAGILFVAAGALVYWDNVVITDIMPILYLLFGVAGLSLVHFLLSGLHRGAWFWLILVYIGLFVLLPDSLLILGLLAIADCWFDIRKHLIR